MQTSETRSTQAPSKTSSSASTSLGTRKPGSSGGASGGFGAQSKHLAPTDTPPGTVVIGDLVLTLPMTDAHYAKLEAALGADWKKAARKAAASGGAEVLKLLAEYLPADLLRTPAAQDLADGYAVWARSESPSKPGGGANEKGIKPGTLSKTDATQSDETDTKKGDGDGNTVFSQAQWYSSGGRPLSADEVRNAVAVLTKHNINEGGSDQGEYLFGADGKPKGLLAWAGTTKKPYVLKPGETTVTYVGCPKVDGREDRWNYWLTSGKKQGFVKSPGMLTSGSPTFTDKGDASTQIASDLLGLDLAFIPGPQSCVRTVYAMQMARDPKNASKNPKDRVAFNPATDRETLLDGPLAAGHQLTVRTRNLGHSILVVEHVGGDEYVVDDPGRNTMGNLGRPRGNYTYVNGDLVRSDKGQTYKIEEIQVIK